jgi:hypothetical protein
LKRRNKSIGQKNIKKTKKQGRHICLYVAIYFGLRVLPIRRGNDDVKANYPLCCFLQTDIRGMATPKYDFNTFPGLCKNWMWLWILIEDRLQCRWQELCGMVYWSSHLKKENRIPKISRIYTFQCGGLWLNIIFITYVCTYLFDECQRQINIGTF